MAQLLKKKYNGIILFIVPIFNWNCVVAYNCKSI